MITDLVYKLYECVLLILVLVVMAIIGFTHLTLNILYGISMMLSAIVTVFFKVLLRFLDN